MKTKIFFAFLIATALISCSKGVSDIPDVFKKEGYEVKYETKDVSELSDFGNLVYGDMKDYDKHFDREVTHYRINNLANFFVFKVKDLKISEIASVWRSNYANYKGDWAATKLKGSYYILYHSNDSGIDRNFNEAFKILRKSGIMENPSN